MFGIRSSAKSGPLAVAAPSSLPNFKGRGADQEIFFRLLDLPADKTLPVLMYFGVGGQGKTSLLQRLRERMRSEHPKIPHAWLDLSARVGGDRFHRDLPSLLGQIQSQLGVPCPRFQLAYAMWRYKSELANRPSLLAGAFSTGGEFAGENLDAILGIGFPIKWLTGAVDAALRKHRDHPIAKWLIPKMGQDDRYQLYSLDFQKIPELLPERLALDLAEALPEQPRRKARAVIFLDTVESLASQLSSSQQRREAERTLREIGEKLGSCLLVLAGQHQLHWNESNPAWGSPDRLVQHCLQGLSEREALDYLSEFNITGPLSFSVLKASSEQTKDDEASTFLPLSLALSVDSVKNERDQGREPAPESFELQGRGFQALAERFLRSLGSDVPDEWILRLAHTPLFDETAARLAFSQDRSAAQDHAWFRLLDFGFVWPAEERHWFRLHHQMRLALLRTSECHPDRARAHHTFWQAHWSSRIQSPHDDYAALAWSHRWALSPQEALQEWNTEAEAARQSLAMSLHRDLVD